MRQIVLNEQMEERIEKIEAVISNLVRNSEDLSDIVAAQDKEISRIKDSLQWLLERDFERQNAENKVTDEKLPPHW
jgi:SlyX protein